MTTTSTLPPPLSAPPTVATLRGLLDGLQQPMQRGVPTPPVPGRVFEEAARPPPTALDHGSALDLTRLEHLAASREVAEPTIGRAPAPNHAPARGGPATPAPSSPPGSGPSGLTTPTLTWSAGRGHRHRGTAALVVVAAAAGTVAALVAVGELALP